MVRLLNWLYGKVRRPRLTGELFQDANNDWRWRLRSRNGEIVAQSEAYTRRESAVDTLRLIGRAKIRVLR